MRLGSREAVRAPQQRRTAQKPTQGLTASSICFTAHMELERVMHAAEKRGLGRAQRGTLPCSISTLRTLEAR